MPSGGVLAYSCQSMPPAGSLATTSDPHTRATGPTSHLHSNHHNQHQYQQHVLRTADATISDSERFPRFRAEIAHNLQPKQLAIHLMMYAENTMTNWGLI
ncbi:unnamed protein product [Protopolystoma xenopodis]|uniref:Uncharacterized protein n=1 Tax=Protopolystoma xenopodis TaxID=117903 RepID=A0A3S5FFI2_9PLAT|nr:unnamed protein product [Protopolystoma xenopodis]